MNEMGDDIKMERDLWTEVLEMLNTSNKKIQIYNGAENIGAEEIETMGIARNSVLGVVVLYFVHYASVEQSVIGEYTDMRVF